MLGRMPELKLYLMYTAYTHMLLESPKSKVRINTKRVRNFFGFCHCYCHQLFFSIPNELVLLVSVSFPRTMQCSLKSLNASSDNIVLPADKKLDVGGPDESSKEGNRFSPERIR